MFVRGIQREEITSAENIKEKLLPTKRHNRPFAGGVQAENKTLIVKSNVKWNENVGPPS